MILRLLSLLALTCGCLSAASAQDSLNFPVLGETIRHAPELDALLAKDTPLHVISSGFDWTEGPVWVREKDGPGYLLFSDIPPNSAYKWVEGQGAKLFLKPSGFTGPGDYGAEPGSNGLLINSQGLLISCEHGDRRLSVLTKDGGKRTLVDNYEGKRLNSPNDVVQHSNGDLLFTDPPYGLPNRWEDPRRELDFCGVYRLTPQGQLTLLTKEMTRPNGIALSPDEKTLYVAQSDPDAAIWKAFPINADGSLGKSRVIYDATQHVKDGWPGLPDGLAVDQAGIIFGTGPGGVYIFSPAGKLLGRISTGERTSNCTFGGADGSQLYITADTYVCRIQTKTKGLGF